MDLRCYWSVYSHLLSLVVIMLFLAGCSGSKKSSPQEFSERSLFKFFNILRSSGLREAYYSTHPIFQSSSPFRTLKDLDSIYGLKQNQGIELSKLSLDKKMIVSTSGSVSLVNSLNVPFQAKFSNHKNSAGVNPWKLIYIEFDMKKFFENQGMVEPDSDLILSIARDYFLLFHSELKRFQLKGFYDSCSEYWRSKISLEKMELLFEPFLNDRFLTEDFRNANFVLNYQSGLRDTGILVAVGNVVGSSKIEFYMEFFFESGHFRPLNFNLKQL